VTHESAVPLALAGSLGLNARNVIDATRDRRVFA